MTECLLGNTGAILKGSINHRQEFCNEIVKNIPMKCICFSNTVKAHPSRLCCGIITIVKVYCLKESKCNKTLFDCRKDLYFQKKNIN